MSADNWAVCPRCNAEAERKHQEAVDAVMATYGKVPIEEFDAARAALPESPSIAETFREDYEFYGAEEGTVRAHYGGRCSECGLSVKFRHEEVFWIIPDEGPTNDCPCGAQPMGSCEDCETAVSGPTTDDREDTR